MESILISLKESLGIEPTSTVYDPELIMHVNAVLMSLSQLGVDPDSTLEVTGIDETWDELFDGLYMDVKGVKSYILHKVKLMFDPPTSSYLVEVVKATIKELEWRIAHAVDNRDVAALAAESPFNSGFSSGFGG